MNKLKWKSSLYSRDFILFFVAIAQASLGSSISVIALAFLVLKITGSASAMALTLGFRILPSIFMPFIATFLDRVYVKPSLVLSFVARGLLLLGLYVGIQKGLLMIYSIYIVALVNGILATIAMPSCQIIIPSLLKKTDLERGNSIVNMAEQSMSFMGLLCGGAVVSIFGPVVSVLIEGICYLISGIMILFISIKKEDKKIKNKFLRDVAIGFVILRDFSAVALITIMCFFINVFFSAVEVFLPLHMNMIAKGAAGYGFFMALMMSGMLLGNTVVALMGVRFKSVLGMAIGWVGLSIAFLGLGIRNSFCFCLVWGTVLGVGVSLINTSIRIILQKTISSQFRGRVNGISVALSSIGMPFAFITLSYIMHAISFAVVFLVGSLFALFFSIMWFVYIKSKPLIFFEEEFENEKKD